MNDIYFDDGFPKLYEGVEGGKAVNYVFESEEGIIRYNFLKRSIPVPEGFGDYYDIVSPYGYGGPYVAELRGDINKLAAGFSDAFAEYCTGNSIVSEFIRFHPVAQNQEPFSDIYDVIYMRETVGTDLKSYEDTFRAEFSKSARKNIRKQQEAGMTYEVIKSPDSLTDFMDIYYETMNRNSATDFYYFGDEYFSMLLDMYKDSVVLAKVQYEGKTICAGLYFAYGDIVHIHLTGTRNDFLHMAPEYLLRHAITEWGINNGFSLIFNGGGRSNSPDDALYRFKLQFCKNTSFPFYIGKKIRNPEVYTRLSEINKEKKGEINESFFPLYRA